MAASGAGPAPPADVPASFWRSLRYFNAYRIALGAFLLLTAAGWTELLGFPYRGSLPLFRASACTYVGAAVLFHLWMKWRPQHFNLQLTIQVMADIVAITLMSHAVGGIASGLPMMLLVSLAAAGLVSRGRLILFYAALATLGVLGEHSARVLLNDLSSSTFVQPGLVSIGYFATAVITSLLAQRVIANERIAQERGLRLANQLKVNELVIQDAQDGILVLDENGHIQQWNRQAEALLPEVFQGGLIGALSPEIGGAFSDWQSEQQNQTTTSVALGKNIKLRFKEAGVHGGSVTVVYLEDLSKLEEQAQQHKLAALGRLTANIAHEIRNPLSAIVHAADLMDEENRAPQRSRLTRIIRDNSARLERIVKDVLELSRRDRAQRERLSLNAFVAGFLAEYCERQGLGMEAIVLEAQEDVVAEFDRVHFNQVLWNLISNACRHADAASGQVRLRLSRASDRLELHVIDDGPGIPPSMRSQLFEPFFTTASGGTGLGLYIARELCVANGAQLDYVDNAKGADFRISWPSPTH